MRCGCPAVMRNYKQRFYRKIRPGEMRSGHFMTAADQSLRNAVDRMWSESSERKTDLRGGLTTGCCATACSIAAAYYLLAGRLIERVEVTLPRGRNVQLEIERCARRGERCAVASTIKDAGDDPDVTHGARVFVELSLRDDPGFEFAAAEGVGTVTRAGLPLAVGEPAINPVPRTMIKDHVQEIAWRHAYPGGFRIAIGIENGATLALKTMNPRLGIAGGLSILGTTGIVRPFSCSAYIASIQQGIDVARANGVRHLAATTGSVSEAFIRDHYQLPEFALIEMGDFAGAVLKHVRRAPVDRLSIVGGFGKITKLAAGHLDLHSRNSSIDFTWLQRCSARTGASEWLQDRIRTCNTSTEVLDLCEHNGIDLGAAVCRSALETTRRILSDAVEVEVWAVNRQGRALGMAAESGP